LWADKDWTENCSALVGATCVATGAGAPFRTSHQVTSGIAGGQIDYNWQASNFVIGIEAMSRVHGATSPVRRSFVPQLLLPLAL
jgi:hypothetical protein